jgi:hypothetical protein
MRTRFRPTTPSLLASAAAFLLLGAPAGAAGAVSPLPASNYAVHPVCGVPTPGYASCLALELTPTTAAARARTHPLAMTSSRPIQPASAAGGAFGLRPQDLHTAYQLPTTAASQQTVAIVDAYNDPNAEADLKVYDNEFLIPECTKGTGCFRQVNQKGEAGNLPFPESQEALTASEATCAEEASATACQEVEEAKGWAEEISLDIEVAHATCQNCRIVLVEAKSPEYKDLEAADNRAAQMGATEISNSWGGGEPGHDSSAFNHPGIVVTASAGDAGYLNWDAENSFEKGFPLYPASSPHVVAVGGTRLTLSGPAHTWQSEAVWNGRGAGGGGCSLKFNSPLWQVNVADWSSVGCGQKRAVADVSAVSDPYTGVAVYDSQPGEEGETWRTLGGTSLAAPLIASVYALAGGGNGVSYPAETLYENEIKSPGSLHDIASGSNGECTEPQVNGISGCEPPEEAATSCSSKAICLARPGYDGPTGVGTPNGIGAFEPGNAAVANNSPGKEAPSTPGEGSSGETPAGTGNASSGGAPPSTTGSAAVVPMLSALSLTRSAIVALNNRRPKASRVRFAFTISAAARVRVTLAKLVRSHGHARWQVLPSSLTIAATRGRNDNHLGGHNSLAPGRYRLMLTPVHGAARSLTFQIG